MVDELATLAPMHGLAIKRCSPSHYQVMTDAGCPLVNVWPTTFRYLTVTPVAGEKSKTGDASDVIAYAIKLRPSTPTPGAPTHASDE